MIRAWIDTSSADTASSQMMIFGFSDSARNTQLLTMAARELVRIVLHLRGPQADLVEQLRNLLAQRRRAQLPPQVVQPSNSISGEANASTIAGPSSISVGVMPLVWIAYARSMALSS